MGEINYLGYVKSYVFIFCRSPLKPEAPTGPITGPFSLDHDLIERLEREPINIIKPRIQQIDLSFLDEPLPSIPAYPPR